MTNVYELVSLGEVAAKYSPAGGIDLTNRDRLESRHFGSEIDAANAGAQR